jgi:hypothetical protein
MFSGDQSLWENESTPLGLFSTYPLVGQIQQPSPAIGSEMCGMEYATRSYVKEVHSSS